MCDLSEVGKNKPLFLYVFDLSEVMFKIFSLYAFGFAEKMFLSLLRSTCLILERPEHINIEFRPWKGRTCLEQIE